MVFLVVVYRVHEFTLRVLHLERTTVELGHVDLICLSSNVHELLGEN